MKFLTLIPTLLISLIMSSCFYTEKADLLVHNAKIYTVDDQFSIQEAMAIKDGKIVEVGPNNQLRNRYDAKDEIDAQLRPIYPGFIDAHCHFLAYGKTFFEVNLVGTSSWEEVIERIKSFAESYSDIWITGRGWDQNDWDLKEFPNKILLDSLFPDKAIFLKRIDGHAAIANQKALDLAKILKETRVEGGIIEKKEGKLTGILIDNAVDLVNAVVPKLSDEKVARALIKAQEMCFAKGLTSVSDAMLENRIAKAIDSLHQSGVLKIKIYGMLSPTEDNKRDFLEKGPYLTDRLNLCSFKYFVDGALGSRGAKLLDPYHDDPENEGLYLNDSSYFANEAKLMIEHGFQMNSHCIGDAANRMMLNIYGRNLKSTNDKRWRIEHAQVVHKDDLELFKKFTIIPSVQPTHATSDMYWLEERLGPERTKMTCSYRDLLNQNGMIALGTDFPVEDIDPLKTFYAAVYRKDANNYPEDGFQMENAISKTDALKGMTIWAAIANFEENMKGSLEVGKSADFIILDQDIMETEESKMLKTNVIGTFINGERVYNKKNSL